MSTEKDKTTVIDNAYQLLGFLKGSFESSNSYIKEFKESLEYELLSNIITYLEKCE